MLSEKPWKPEAGLYLLVGLWVSLLMGMIAVYLIQSPAVSAPPFSTFVIGTIVFHWAALVLVYFFLKFHQVDWAEGFGFRTSGLGRALALALVVGVAVLPIAWFLSYFSSLILTRIGSQPEPQATIQMLRMEIPIAQRIYIGISAILLAPVVEELLFRGILYPMIKQRGYPRLALWGTALVFAAIHSNLMTFIPLAFFAVVLTLLYETTDNLLAPIVSHSLFNAANYFWLISTLTPAPVPPLG